MSHTYTNLIFHAVFSTKDRRPTIGPAIRDRLYGYLGDVLDRRGGRLIRVGGTADHVHLLFELDATQPVADVIRVLKANSSKWLHEHVPDAATFAWQSGYAAFTVSRSAVADVVRYIDRQEQHHRTRTFEDEFRAFLDRHEIAYKDRFVFG